MTFEPQKLVSVYYNNPNKKYFVGRLLLKERRIFFEYDSEFVATGFELSPFKLPLKKAVVTSSDRVFDGLFGLFNDSLPDGWGRILLDRKLLKLEINPGVLSPLDRLCFVGSHGMGALSYEPESQNNIKFEGQDLDEIHNEIRAFQESDDDRFIDDLLVLCGSSAGARPKILLKVNDEDWLIKFKSNFDPKDIGPIEYAYHLMAVECALDVPEAKLFSSKNGLGFFGVKGFDRNKGSVHMHSIAGLLHSDSRDHALDYEIIMKTALFLTRKREEVEKQYRNVVFNVLSHNRDDHSKNFSFLMDISGTWTVSPAYDLTFSNGPRAEHSTTIMGEGKHPGKKHLLQLAAKFDINKQKATRIIDQVMVGISKWEYFAESAGVSNSQIKMIQNQLDLIKKSF